ncbi:MAG TPA: creatininase family protein [Candidatus Eisenbacteria bacterium]|nr:creatininase family protein [Candidatus Eisenbacteria bacterium]
MTVPRWADLTWEEVRDLPRERLTAILPVGAVEAHGPHLPLGTDLVIAEAMARAGGDCLAGAGIHAVLLPALPYTAAPFGAAFAGTVSMPADIVTGLVAALARELKRHGVAALAVANAHLDPAHVGALQEAVDRARRDGSIPIVCPLLTRKPWALRLTDEFRTGACHAGRYEGSIVMAERPDLVRREVMRSLPPNPASLSRAIRDGKGTFEEAGGPRAYFGWPADATDAEGRETIEALGQILCDAVLEAFGSEHATI